MVLQPKIRCRGLSLQSYIATFESLRGSEERVVLLDTITPELRDALAYGEVIAGGYYDLDWLIELHRVGRHIARGGATFPRTMGLTAVKRDLRGPFAFLMKFVSVANLFRRSAKVWDSYWDGGSVCVYDARPGHVSVDFKEAYGFDENLWQDVVGGCLAILELAGTRNGRLTVEPPSTPTATYVTAFEWDG